MAKTATIRARVDADLKAQAEKILEKLGLNADDAVRMLYRQITLHKGLPFDVKIPNAATRKAIREARAGKNLNHYASPDELYEKLGI